MATTQLRPLDHGNSIDHYQALPPRKYSDTNYLCVAIGIIILIGSVIAACYLFQEMGPPIAFAVGGIGIIAAIALIAIGQCGNGKNAQYPVSYNIVDDRQMTSDHLYLYLSYLATKNPLAILPVEKEYGFPARRIKYGKNACLEARIYGIKDLINHIKNDFPHSIDNFENLNLPIVLNISDHWTLIYIDREKRTVEYYDSIVGYKKRQMRKKLKSLTQALSSQEPDQKPYQFIPKITSRLQFNGYDCGVWALFFLENRLLDPEFNFNQLALQREETTKLIYEYRKKVKEKLTLA